jgi:hypothetical protein
VFRQAVGNMMNRLLIQEIKGEKIIWTNESQENFSGMSGCNSFIIGLQVLRLACSGNGASANQWQANERIGWRNRCEHLGLLPRAVDVIPSGREGHVNTVANEQWKPRLTICKNIGMSPIGSICAQYPDMAQLFATN